MSAGPEAALRPFGITTDDGVRLRGVVRDARDGALPVVLVNGLTMTVAAWDGLERLLAEDRSVVRYDMRGQGESDAPAGPYPPSRHAADLLQMLRQLHLGSVHLVALSNGGLVAQRVAAALASDTPADASAGAPGGDVRLASLALLDSFALVDAHLRAVLRSWLGALAAGGAEARFDAAVPWVWGPAFLEANEAALADARALAGTADDHAVRGLIEGLLTDETRAPVAGLERVRVPLLIAVGAHDVLTPPRASAAIAHAFGRGEVRTIADVGHAAPLEDPRAVAVLVRPFLLAAETEES